MTYVEAMEEARKLSHDDECVQHVNLDFHTNQFYVSDWYDEASTIVSYECGFKF